MIRDAGPSGLRGFFSAHSLARYSTALALSVAVAFVWLSLQAPRSDVAFVREGGVVTVLAPAGALRLGADTTVTLQGVRGARVVLPAAELCGGGSDTAHTRLAALLGEGPVSAQARDVDGVTRTFSVRARQGRLSDLTARYWQSFLCGAISMLFGIAVWLIQRRNWGAAWFAWVGVWLFASAATAAFGELWNVATPGWVIALGIYANGGTLQAFALAFVALFARFPSPLIPRRVILPGLWVAAAAGAASVAALPRGSTWFGGLQIAEYLGLLALLVGQLWVNRADPAKRPTLLILVGTIALGVALYLLITLLPMLGLPAPLGEAVTLPLFCLIYGGIGLSIVGSGVFTLDGWSRSIMLSIAFSAVVLVVDLGLLRWLTGQEDVALGVSVAAVSLAYLPTREWLSRRAERRRDAQAQRALSLAADLAFATSDEGRASGWRDAVEATFRPLETVVDPSPAKAPELAEGGVALRVPAVAGAPSLICRHADGGRRAFRRADVEAATALVALVTRMVDARDAYVKGANEERGRIARDLHDNVSGRLIGSLIRGDVATIKHDVRDAMADIHSIINRLGGEERRLGELLADLRHECQTRCQGAGLTLQWPPGAELESDRPVSYEFYRHLTALVRESISNILRHAGASRVEVAITVANDRLSAVIADDGRGLAATRRAGRGLANSTERARLLGGGFEAAAASGGGTLVRFDVGLG